jgi:hypothetical protein
VFSGALFDRSHVSNDVFGPPYVASGADPLVALSRLTARTAMTLLPGLLCAKPWTLAAPVFADHASNRLAAVAGTVLG